MAIPVLTENDLRETILALDAFKASGLTASRFDPELPSGKTVSFQRTDEEGWVLK